MFYQAVWNDNSSDELMLRLGFTDFEPEPLNWRQLPAPYKRLIQNLKQLDNTLTLTMPTHKLQASQNHPC